MSRSNKSRFGTKCKFWKDSVRESRSNKRSWTKSKKLRSRAARLRAKTLFHSEKSD